MRKEDFLPGSRHTSLAFLFCFVWYVSEAVCFKSKKGCYANILHVSGMVVSCWVTLVMSCHIVHNHNVYIFNHLNRTWTYLHAFLRMHVPLLLDCNSVVPCHHKNCLSFLHVSHTFLNTRVSLLFIKPTETCSDFTLQWSHADF